ncbi:MAG: GNAT family N-acetyltransferase [Bacteroides sp.]|nr:GNAT family N-acetyltransferase [Bacteroides sp.]
MSVYEAARSFMRKTGNGNQWINGYPSRQLIAADIAAGNSYVVEYDGRMAGVFTFIEGNDPTYDVIEGKWLHDRPYGTIHRIGSAGIVRGVADVCLAFCRSQGVSVRIDTHADNTPMLNWIKKSGFTYCGVIHVEDGSPREAFQIG